jgi:hypothetical protein
VDQDEPSRAIFRALIKAAEARHNALKGEFESVKSTCSPPAVWRAP